MSLSEIHNAIAGDQQRGALMPTHRSEGSGHRAGAVCVVGYLRLGSFVLPLCTSCTSTFMDDEVHEKQGCNYVPIKEAKMLLKLKYK